MRIQTDTPDQYITQLPDERKEAISKLREVMAHGMIGYVFLIHNIRPGIIPILNKYSRLSI